MKSSLLINPGFIRDYANAINRADDIAGAGSRRTNCRRLEPRATHPRACLSRAYGPEVGRHVDGEDRGEFARNDQSSGSRPRKCGGAEGERWLLIGKDIAINLISQFFRSRLGRYVAGAFVAWMLLFVVGYFSYGPTPGHPALHAFEGFFPGMLAMYIATRLYGTPQTGNSRFFRSRFDIYVVGVFVAWMLLFVIGYYFYGPTRGRPALQAFGGCLLGMVAMYIATRVYGMPHNSSHSLGS